MIWDMLILNSMQFTNWDRALLARIGRCFTIGCLNGFPYQQHVEENSPEKRGDERGG